MPFPHPLLAFWAKKGLRYRLIQPCFHEKCDTQPAIVRNTRPYASEHSESGGFPNFIRTSGEEFAKDAVQ